MNSCSSQLKKTLSAKMIGLFFALLAVFAFSENTFAGSGCIGWYSTNESGQLSYFNPQTSAYTLLNTYSSVDINAGAVQASTGNLYFVDRANNKLVVYSKATNSFTVRSGTVPPPSTGSIVGATFSNTGTLYVMYSNLRMIVVDPATGNQVGSTITYSGTGTNTSGRTNGDIAFDSAGQMWMVANSGATTFRLYKLTVSGTSATATAYSSNITGISGTVAGLVIAPTSGSFFISTEVATYQINPLSGAAVTVVGDGANDLSGCSVSPDAPTTSKSFSAATVNTIPATSTLTLNIGNSNSTEDYLISSFTDTLPTGMVVASPNGLSGSCTTVSGNSVTATAGSGAVTFAEGGKIPIGGCTINVNVSVSAVGTYTNTIAAGDLKTLAGNNASAATATLTAAAPDLSITKSHTGNFVRGSAGTYTLTVANSGNAATSGTITVTDTLPTGMTVNGGAAGSVADGGANAANWTCSSSAVTVLATQQIITCTSTTSIAASGSSTFTLTIDVGAATASSVTNSATVAGGGEPAANNGNNSASDATTVTANYSVTGIIFEDSGYAGGAGRSLASSGGVGRGGATVELYNSLGILIATAATATSGTAGQYQFPSVAPGNYTVRVVSSTVSSARAGYNSSLVGVQTFRTSGATADINRVGGEDPTKIDAGANTLGASLVSLIAGSNTAQSISPITVSTSNLTGIDFGFNFDTIVNINDAGQGSLRQFINNANALSGADTTIFMISDGAAHSGLRAGLTNQLSGGAANISVSSALPAVTDSLTTIDGTTQTNNVGNTNSGSLGTGGAVGVDNLSLSTVNRPEVQISNGGGLTIGLDLQGTSETVRGISIYGFGTASNNDSSANIRIGASANSILLEQNIIGSTATAFADPGSGARSGGDNIRSIGGDNGIIRNNLIAFSAGKGIGLEAGSTGWTVENNEIRGNAIGNSNLDGIDLETAGTTGNTVRGNLIYGNEGVGVDSYGSNGSNTVVNNTIYGNGAGAGSNVETSGIRMYGAGNIIDRNKIYSNYGAGVMITSGASANTITRNSIYANGTILKNNGGAASAQIGIDLLSASDNASTGTAPYVSVNDAGDADAGGNGLLNFPVLENAQISGGNLILKGFARPGSTVEFFVAAPDASGFGEGQTYLVTLTEGSAQDTDAATGTYTSPFNGRTVGTDTTNRFSFSIALPSGVASGTVLTATATVGGATSEFSNNVTIANAPPAIDLLKSVSPTGTQLPGTDLTYTIAFTNTGGQSAVNFILTDPNPADTTLKLNANTDFKLGSVVNALGTTGLAATVSYSNDNGTTFAYTPVSGGGGAAAGYDRNVTHIRWNFTGGLSQTSPNNTGSVSFIVKIR